jgi:hypothetical protein
MLLKFVKFACLCAEISYRNRRLNDKLCLPGLVYHPHLRPYTAPVAAFLDLSSTLQSQLPKGVPSPSELLHRFSQTLIGASSPLESIARALSLPPIHVDQVAEAICVAVDKGRADVRGVYGVREMRDLII